MILDRAIDRTSGGGSAAVDQGLNIGQFASISSVIRTYLGANDYTQIRNFGLLLGLLGVIAVAAFLDREYGWFLGEDRRKLRTLAFAWLASLAAPLSWFILAKAHAYAHQTARFYPLACADVADRRRDGSACDQPGLRGAKGLVDLVRRSSSRSQFRPSSC